MDVEMNTEIIRININSINNCKEETDKLKHAAEVIKKGGLVAFPTETVYGLGANALDAGAVKKIFEAKGRPSDNPLIVHIADISSLGKLIAEMPGFAHKLIDEFWPGPLTLIFKKSGIIPYEITAGLDTVAIRMPAHPVALALIKEAEVPIAAPSANSSGKPSPTLAEHVIEDLMGKIDMIIDGGATNVGVESTVLDITSNPPVILRPGGITFEQLREVLGNVELDPSLKINDKLQANQTQDKSKKIIPRSPGMKYRHYSPKANLIIVEGDTSQVIKHINEMANDYRSKSIKVGILATDQTKSYYTDAKDVVVISMGDRNHPDTIASSLFNCFREFDHMNVQVILAEAIDKTGIGLAVMNRMNKAAGYNIIKV